MLLQNQKQVLQGDFFKGYDAIVWLIVLLQTAGGIIIAFVMKFASNILKCLAIGLSICFCAVYSVVVGELKLTGHVALGVFLVCSSVLGYSLHSKPNTGKSTSGHNTSSTVEPNDQV